MKATPITLVLESLSTKSFLLNIIDCPGHVNFADESTAALRAADGAVIVIDAIEGVMMTTERLIKHALANQVAISVVINKMDRLILELKLPPQDAYFKIQHTLEEVNNIIAANSTNGHVPLRISPENGNVCFASGQHRWSFTLKSFAQKYCEKNKGMQMDDMAKRLWGDWYFKEADEREGKAFTKSKPGPGSMRTFVQFILEPLYKIYSLVIGENPETIIKSLRKLGIVLKMKDASRDPKPLLKLVFSKFFGYPRGFVDMIAQHVPSPLDNAEAKVAAIYSGFQTTETACAMRKCSSSGPLMINIVKMISNAEGNKFSCLGRIFSGTISSNQRVKVLGEAFTEDDDEDMAVVEVGAIHVGVGRFVIEVTSATAGNLILLEGVDSGNPHLTQCQRYVP
jgi:116 kDa U5 small nuclear ribonucleoprotein component